MTGSDPSPTSVVGLSTATAIGGGESHTCAILPTGAMYCWGNDDYGQLGDSSISSNATPAVVPGLSSGVTLMSVGYHHTCAVVSGTLKCWGANNYGQLGDGSLSTRTSATSVAW